jgi:hypothetical protein
MRRCWVVLATMVLAAGAGCSAIPAAGGGTGAHPADARPAAQSVSASVIPPAASVRSPGVGGQTQVMPRIVRAQHLAGTQGAGILAPGTPVAASDVGPRAAASGQLIFGLADGASLAGQCYPAISTDGGRTWEVDGPRFSYAGADGAAATSSIAARAPDTLLAWGHGGNFVKVSTDGGRHWMEAVFPAGVESMTAGAHGRFAVRALGPQTAGGEFTTFRYVSADAGLRWRLRGQLGDVPY